MLASTRRIPALRHSASYCVQNSIKRLCLSSATFPSPKLHSSLIVSDEVLDALAHKRPVVALETALVTHGMPYPYNLQTALSCEEKVRESGAIPATIGVLNGCIHVGLSKSQLERLADPSTPSTKVSRRDIAPVIATRGNGGTTISGTTVIAHLAGIRLFATGGLGGVHRGGENSMDISADLTELGRTPVAVFAGGVKSILDIGRTLEYLETQGVPVITYGPAKEFPAFFSPHSGFQSAYNVGTPLEAAKIVHASSLLLENGLFFGVPIPSQYEQQGLEIQKAVDQAVAESEENGMAKKGKEVTPWLLKRVTELTSGRSLESNIALIENATRIGGQVAVEYAKLLAGDSQDQDQCSAKHVYTPIPPPPAPTHAANVTSLSPLPLAPPRVAIIGGSAVDIISKPTPSPSLSLSSTSSSYTTVPGIVSTSLGGVGRNVAEASHRILSSSAVTGRDEVLLLSPIGADSFGSILRHGLTAQGMRTDGLLEPENMDRKSEKGPRTAVVNMFLSPQGDLNGGVADMDIFQSFRSEEVISRLKSFERPKVLMVDGNLSEECLKGICEWAKGEKIPTFFEPTSVPKSLKILPALSSLLDPLPSILPGRLPPSAITFISPNIHELQALYNALDDAMELNPLLREHWWTVIDDLQLGEEYQTQLSKLAKQSVNNNSKEDSGTLEWLVRDGIARMAVQLLPFFQHLVIKCGESGIVLASRVANTPGNSWASQPSSVQARQVISKGKSSIFILKHFPAIPLKRDEIVNVTGAGDSLVGSMLASLAKLPDAMDSVRDVDRMIEQAQKAAVMSLKSDLAVSPFLTSLNSRQ